MTQIVMFFLLHPVAWVLYHRRTIYLFSERGYDARDNGFYMFRFFREEHPELESYYIIDPSSADYDKVGQYGASVAYRSIRHYLLYIAAQYKISTHIMGCAPDHNLFEQLSRFYKGKGRQIFLQHGVTKDDIEGLYQERAKLDIFICGAKPEYDFVVSHFHYRNGEVKYTGLARYDGLQHFETKRQILLMPTWRYYLMGASEEQLRSSMYYEHWNRLMLDRSLQDSLEYFDMQLIFYPHYEIQEYISCFETESSRIKIADFNHYDVQTLLKESMLLVTDYSSVFFDFAYMGKPCIYYQFDEEKFFAEHYHRGYFDYRKMGFGPVCTEHDSCVKAIIRQIENACMTEDEYKSRMKDFFPLHDDRNCERIFKEIVALR